MSSHGSGSNLHIGGGRIIDCVDGIIVIRGYGIAGVDDSGTSASVVDTNAFQLPAMDGCCGKMYIGTIMFYINASYIGTGHVLCGCQGEGGT